MKLLNDFAIALVKPSRYRELLPNSVGRTALFVTVLILISSVTLITGSIMLYRMLGQYYAENVPEFEFKDQTLMCEDTFDPVSYTHLDVYKRQIKTYTRCGSV